MPKAFANENGMRVWPWRAIGTGYNKFAAEAFLDEVAQAMGRDPLALRLELTKNHPRANAVIKAVAEMSDFAKKRPDRGKGIAFAIMMALTPPALPKRRWTSKPGKSRVHNLWMAIDPGVVVHPDQVHAQLESGLVFGLSAALFEELTFKDGAPQATNFDSYPVLRMADMPEIHTKIVASDALTDRHRRGRACRQSPRPSPMRSDS